MKQLSGTITRHERLLGYLYLIAEILVLPFLLGICNVLFGLKLSDAELNFLYFSINFIAVAIIFRRFLLENAKTAFKAMPSILISAGAGYVLCHIANIAIAILISLLSPTFQNVNDTYISEMVSNDYTIMFIGTVILVPMTEELLYRGLFFNGIYRKNRFLAYCLSVLIFASVHVYGYIGQFPPILLLLCLIEYIPSGLILAWSYARTNTIITPILIHMLINSSAVLTMR